MSMKEKQRSAYKSMQGKEIDIHKIIMQNEMTVAVGNVKVNARGDELGPGGQIVRKREELIREANNARPNQTVKRPEAEPTPVAQSKPLRKNIRDMDPEGDE